MKIKITQSQRKVKALGPTKPNRPKRNSQNGLRQTLFEGVGTLDLVKITKVINY
jgi:hypothetical protein